LERLRELGLDDGINYASRPVVEEVLALTEGRGVDVILESVGGEGLLDSMECLAYRGRCVSLGDAGRGGTAMVDAASLRPKNLTLSGYFMGMEMILRPDSYDSVATILDEVSSGSLRVVIDRGFPLANAAEAHAYIESRQAFGRVILVP
jgi:NADPH2:quinone reductase